MTISLELSDVFVPRSSRIEHINPQPEKKSVLESQINNAREESEYEQGKLLGARI